MDIVIRGLDVLDQPVAVAVSFARRYVIDEKEAASPRRVNAHSGEFAFNHQPCTQQGNRQERAPYLRPNAQPSWQSEAHDEVILTRRSALKSRQNWICYSGFSRWRLDFDL